MFLLENAVSQFTSTNATNPTTLWTPTETVNIGDIRRIGSITYRSVINNNVSEVGYDPDDLTTASNYPPNTLGLYWIVWGVANDYAMLDILEETKTQWVADGVVEFLRGSLDTLAIGQFNATTITIDYLDDVGAIIADESQVYTFSLFSNMYNEYWYAYGGFEYDSTNVIYQYIKKIGVKIRVTFSVGGGATYCGFFGAGNAIDMGKTIDRVSLSNTQYGTRYAKQASFTTITDKTKLIYTNDKGNLYKENETPLLIIVDPSEDSNHKNVIILGKIKECTAIASNASKNELNWVIEQNIRS